jgi:hypothetical protein
MSDGTEAEEVQWPSIDDHSPHEEGGPTARAGLSYQDEIVVGIFLDMIADASIKRVHCETHDDIAVVKVENATDVVEYVQVKSNEPDSLWSVASLCAKADESVCAKSLRRDQHKETSRFRIVTLRDVHSDLKLLTYPCYGLGREADCDGVAALSAAMKSKLPDLQSAKGNDIDYWLEHCRWDVRYDEKTIHDGNIFRTLKLAASHGVPILPEHAEVIENELCWWAHNAGRAFWVPDKEKKIIRRDQLLSWWTQKLDSIASGGSNVAGSKLRGKMDDAELSDDQIRMALELRREYAQMVRTPRYMSEPDVQGLQRRVKSALASLRAEQMAGTLPANGAAFHSLCLRKMDAISNDSGIQSEDRSAFLKGCMYDITDRCLHRFARHPP